MNDLIVGELNEDDLEVSINSEDTVRVKGVSLVGSTALGTDFSASLGYTYTKSEGQSGTAGGYSVLPPLAARFISPRPLLVGLGEERLAQAELLRQQTTNEARILWEDLDEDATSPQRWTPLLPLLTGRSFLGGLDPEANIEHGVKTSFTYGVLAGRPVREWSRRFCSACCAQTLPPMSTRNRPGRRPSRGPAARTAASACPT